jgi:hypothetical protein
MAMKKPKDIKDFIYVRVIYVGWIPELKANGPCITWMKKEMVVTLIKNGYIVDIMDKVQYADFVKELEDYYAARKEHNLQVMEEIRANMLSKELTPIGKILDQNKEKKAIVNDIIDKAMNGNPVIERRGAPTPTGIDTPVIQKDDAEYANFLQTGMGQNIPPSVDSEDVVATRRKP